MAQGAIFKVNVISRQHILNGVIVVVVLQCLKINFLDVAGFKITLIAISLFHHHLVV